MADARTRGGSLWPAGSAPALAVLVLGLAVVLLRPPLPIDETRYLEVFHESLRGSALLLRLSGEPYAEKPPLLFWLGRLLGWTGLPADVALRVLPTLCLAGTVLCAARLGRRLGLELVGACLASLWLAAGSVQFLHFDPLLSLTVWGALEAATRGSQRGVWAWSSAALLAKGPVAFLFLVPFLWAFAPVCERGAGKRLAAALLLAWLPLAAWALAAAALGGEAFAHALLWDRWAGRVVKSADHARAWWFYLPVALLGSLPLAFVLFRRERGGTRSPGELVHARLGQVLLALFVVFTLISGKQAHYLEPLLPAAALLCAGRIERLPAALAWLRRGLVAQLLLLFVVTVAGFVALPKAREAFGARGMELFLERGFVAPLALSAAAALAALVLVLARPADARRLLATGFVASALVTLPIHWLAGELLFPHELARALRTNSAAVAHLGSSHHGLFAWLASALPDKLTSPAELTTWSAAHPGGLVVLEEELAHQLPPAGGEILLHDVVHRTPIVVWRARGGAADARAGSSGRSQ